jgi:hypothetical protein
MRWMLSGFVYARAHTPTSGDEFRQSVNESAENYALTAAIRPDSFTGRPQALTRGVRMSEKGSDPLPRQEHLSQTEANSRNKTRGLTPFRTASHPRRSKTRGAPKSAQQWAVSEQKWAFLILGLRTAGAFTTFHETRRIRLNFPFSPTWRGCLRSPPCTASSSR